jgi:peptidoglycan/LPS O-acetylase OafA/YrhL
MSARASHIAGDLGVRTFFVLSGFLITTLLLRERQQTGRISLLEFYVRRAYRIFPAFYAYLIIVGTLAAVRWIELLPGDLFAAATYTTNFHAMRSWWTGHLWSLAVEEQFYVIWPLLLVVLGMARAPVSSVHARGTSVPRAWYATLFAIFAAPIIRVATWRWMPHERALVDQAFPCIFDALATGCALALVMPHHVRSERIARLLAARWFWPCVALGFLPTLVTNPFVSLGIAMTCANLSIAAIILRCVSRPDTAVSRTLERRPFVWVGTLSYSLYLWQQLFIDRHSEQWIHQFPVNVGFALCAAVACHYLIEQPFLRLSARRRAEAEARAATGLAVLGPPNEVIDVSAVRASQVARAAKSDGITGTWSTDPQRGQ